MKFKFGLDKSSKKYVCPACGYKTFVVYLNNETNEPVDIAQYGRCDRENSCTYHQHPKTANEIISTTKDAVVQIYPCETDVDRITSKNKDLLSALHQYWNKKGIPIAHFLKFGVYSETDATTVFTFENIEKKIVNFKWIKYDSHGHRRKDTPAHSLRNPSPSNSDGNSILTQKYKLCLFGEHLLDPTKERPVVIVESEKTAVIASFHYPQFDWVSCSSNNGLTDEKISVLHNRKVYWLCDADGAGRKNKSIERASKYIDDFYIVDLFSDRMDGYDICDAIDQGLHPEIEQAASRPDAHLKLQANESKSKNSDLIGYDYDLPDGVVFEMVKEDIQKYNFFEQDGRIFIVRKRKGDSERGAQFYCDPITNFVIRPLGLISRELEPSRLVEIKNIHGFCKVVQIPTKAFASPNEFTVFIEGVGNFQYNGVGTDLKKIRAKLYDSMTTFEEVENLGWHPSGIFFFANGGFNRKFIPINKYGFIRLGDQNFFIQPLSCLTSHNSEEWEDERKFIYREVSPITPSEWAKLFCEVHKDNGRIALAWFLTSLFRDIIYQRFKFFPHLFLFGPPGTGKSQLGWGLRSLGFSGVVKPFNLNSGTAVAFHREFAHFKNFPAWCDEYSNGMLFERIQALKAAYDGVGHKKSVKDSDKRTKSTQVNRAILISGQELPIADNALFKRVILLHFNQTDYTPVEKKLFTDLQRLEEHGLSFITGRFLQYRKVIEEKYYNAFDTVLTDLMSEINRLGFHVEDRIARNACVILTTIKVLEEDLRDCIPFGYHDLLQLLIKNIKDQMSLLSNSNETSTFWDTVTFLNRKGDIKEGEDYCFETRSTFKVTHNNTDTLLEFVKQKELLLIRFSKVIPLYREAFKRQNNSNASAMDKSSLIHYLQQSKAYLGYVDKFSFKESRTSCYCFDYEMLKAFGVNLDGSET